MFKNKKKESEKKRKIRELTELVEKNEEKYQTELEHYKKHIDDNKLLLDNISNSYDEIINDNKKLRDQLLKKEQDIFDLKQEIQSKLQDNVSNSHLGIIGILWASSASIEMKHCSRNKSEGRRVSQGVSEPMTSKCSSIRCNQYSSQPKPDSRKATRRSGCRCKTPPQIMSKQAAICSKGWQIM